MLRTHAATTLLLACPAAFGQLGPELPLNTPVARIGGIAVGDVTGDGLPDLLVADDSVDRVFLVESIDGKEFRAGFTLNIAEPNLFDIELLDYDVDGHLDIVTFHGGPSARMRVYRNTGGGTFEFVQANSIINLQLGSKETKVVDVDQDGDPDLLLSTDSLTRAGYYAVNMGGGSFTFTGPVVTSNFVNRRGLASLDMNGDGFMDLLGYGATGILSWWPYLGGTSFGAPVAAVGQPQGVTFDDVETMDLDGDGDLDVLARAAINPFGSIWAFENEGAGVLTFRDSSPLVSLQGTNLNPADVNLDGVEDIVTYSIAEQGGTVVSAMLRGPGFTFLPATVIAAEPRPVVDSVFTDISGDGLPDLIRGGTLENVFLLSSNAGSAPGTIAFEAEETKIVDSRAGVRSVRVVDWDTDGDLDILTSCLNFREPISVHENVGLERFRAPREILGGPAEATQNVDVADVNGDGRPDFVTVDSAGDVQLCVQQPGGDVMVQTLGSVSTMGDLVTEGPFFMDVDTDGDLDVIVPRRSPNELLAFDQTSPGVFAAARTIATASSTIQSFVVGDIDGDSVNDLAVMATAGQTLTVEWYSGDGAGNFVFEALLASQMSSGRSLNIIDLDNSPIKDLLWLTFEGKTLEYCQGRVGGLFFSPRPLVTFARRPQVLLVKEPVGLDKPDLLVGTAESFQSNQLVVLDWQVSQTYSAAIAVDGLPRCASLDLADLDADGDADVVAAFTDGARASWFRGTDVDQLGTHYCQQDARNSQNRFGQIVAFGSGASAPGPIELRVQELPPNAAVLFLVGSQDGFIPQAGGSLGNLCLGGGLGRFQLAGQVGFTGPDGSRSLVADLAALPQPNGTAFVLSGEEWFFQAWHRDTVGGVAASNFTNALGITFQ